MRIPVLICAASLAACGGSQSASVSPELGAEQVVRGFMKAAADSNVARMGDLWGNNRGPANQTHYPPEYEKRLAIMQIYLRGDSIRIVSNVSVRGNQNERQLAVELHRATCVKLIPFTAIKSSRGWLVETVDIGAAGSPTRPCGSF